MFSTAEGLSLSVSLGDVVQEDSNKIATTVRCFINLLLPFEHKRSLLKSRHV
jgi:hypothetical protein